MDEKFEKVFHSESRERLCCLGIWEDHMIHDI
jgi:hypothetical protein